MLYAASCLSVWDVKVWNPGLTNEIIYPVKSRTTGSMFRMWNWLKAHFGIGTSVNLCSSSSSPSLTAPLQTPCWSLWPAWLCTQATSSCRSTLWPSYTTLRLSSDTATLPTCLWLPVRPPAPPACLCIVSWARGWDCSRPRWGRTLFLLLFTADSMSKVNALHMELEVMLGEVISWVCFSFTDTFGLEGRRGGCAWFRLLCCLYLLKSSAPHSLENM